MKNTVKKLLSILIIITIIFSFGMVYANDNSVVKVTESEYSEAYKKWLELDEEEKLINFNEERQIISITTRFKAIVYFYFENSKENKNKLLEYVYNLGGDENATH